MIVKMVKTTIYCLAFLNVFYSTIMAERQVCYNCQYTITSTKQGIECASAFNDTKTIAGCKHKCIIHSEKNIETNELRSYFRGCGPGYSKNGCFKTGNMETCYYTCTEHFCNGIEISEKKNASSHLTRNKTLSFLVLLFLCLYQTPLNI